MFGKSAANTADLVWYPIFRRNWKGLGPGFHDPSPINQHGARKLLAQWNIEKNGYLVLVSEHHRNKDLNTCISTYQAPFPISVGMAPVFGFGLQAKGIVPPGSSVFYLTPKPTRRPKQ